MACTELSFIVSDGPKLQEEAGTRFLIRRHAMKDVASTRKKRAQARLAQTTTTCTSRSPVKKTSRAPVRCTLRSGVSHPSEKVCPDGHDLILPGQAELDITELASEEGFEDILDSLLDVVIPSSLLSGYERARSKYSADVLDLSMLTSYNVGKGTKYALNIDPPRLKTLLGHRQWSFLDYVPCRYEISPCLAAATDCLMAKIQSLLHPSTKHSNEALLSYTKALNTLQSALIDPIICLDPETLGASMMLGLHELLNQAQPAAWFSHLRGTAQLIQHRGPEKFCTEYEQALFAAHVGPAAFDYEVIDDPFYIASPRWLSVYASLELDTSHISNRSPLALRMRSNMITLCRVWFDIDQVVNAFAAKKTIQGAKLIERCGNVHKALVNWLDEFRFFSERHPLDTADEEGLRRELLGACLMCLVAVKRLLDTLAPDTDGTTEREVQSIANQLVAMQARNDDRHSWLYLAHEVGIAQAALRTTDLWRSINLAEIPCKHDREEQLRMRYRAWCAAVGWLDRTCYKSAFPTQPPYTAK